MKVIKTSILFIFGCLLLYLIIFSRIYLYLFGKKPISFEHIILVYLSLLWTILLLLLSIGAIILLLNKIIFKKENKFIANLKEISTLYSSFINDSIYQVYESTLNFFEKHNFHWFGVFIWKYLEYSAKLLIKLEPYSFYLNIFFLKLPIIIFSSSLFFCVCISTQTSSFFYSISPVILIYFVFKGWISIVNNFAIENFNLLKNIINYKITHENDDTYLHFLGFNDDITIIDGPTLERAEELFVCFIFTKKAYKSLIESTNQQIFDWISLFIAIEYFCILSMIIYNIFITI